MINTSLYIHKQFFFFLSCPPKLSH